MSRPIMSLANIMIIVVLLMVAFGPLQTVQAHDGSRFYVTQLEAGRPAPIINGICAQDEYDLSRSYYLYYEPNFQETAQAKIQSVWKDEVLYICISSLKADPAGDDDSVSIAFDIYNNGGAHPQTDDLLFSFYHDNSTTAKRGDGTHFVLTDSLNSYYTLAHGDQNIYPWQIEFSFSRSLFADGSGGFYSPGIHIRHNRLEHVGDDYAYPSRAYWNVPFSWADMRWMGVSSTIMRAWVDAYRLTQGIDTESAPGAVTYDKVAGKDTLVRAQLFTYGAITPVTGASCWVVQGSHLSDSGVRTLITPRYTLVPASLNPAPVLLPAPVGFFNGARTVDCWIPAGVVFDPGEYVILMVIDRNGAERVALWMGVYAFWATKDVRVLFYPAVFPTTHPEYRLWSDTLWSQVFTGMRHYARFNPYHSGAGPVDLVGTLSGKPGVRYMQIPAVYSCTPQATETMTDTVHRCDNETRATASRMIGTYNALLNLADTVIPGPGYRDRFDWAAVLYATPRTGGGASCALNRGERSFGEGVDTIVRGDDGIYSAGGSNGVLIGHEMNHCMGLVASSSANSDGAGHSTQANVNTYGAAARMINMETRQTVNTPGSHMYPWFSYGTDGTEYLQSIEWHQLRQILLTMTRPPLPPRAPSQARPETSEPLFQILGTIDPNDNVDIISAQRVDDLALETTTEADDAPYELVFTDQYLTPIGTYGFDPFASAPDIPTSKYGSFYIVTPLPIGTTRVVLVNVKENWAIYVHDFTASKPVISGVALSVEPGLRASMSPGSSTDGLTQSTAVTATLSWTGSDPDSSDLSYAIYLLPDQGKAPLLLADGLTDPYFEFNSDFAPASSQARFLIEASDGYNTTVYTTTTSFTIPQNPPAVDIVSPTPYDTLVAGTPFQLVGTAYDFSGTSLSQQALTWSSDLDGPLGHGEQLSTTLTAGEHTITLEATAGGQTGSVTTTLTLSADSDGDGLPDDYEDLYSWCLLPDTPDDQEDPDGDELLNYGEFLEGTHPCLADTDSDGFGDGDELRRGSDPTEFDSTPGDASLFVEETSLDLGTCPDATGATINLETFSGQDWTLSASDTWFSAPGSGTGSMSIPVTPVCEGLPSGGFTGQVILSAEGAQPRMIEVILDVPYKVFMPLVRKN